ncbi:glucosaminidase domain-containing protein [Neolewinella antarctica]|uniref:Peptidoglycan hydrolase n=1 Tax=Neolewinella antarctica TaxID=442734 RepID=A0ABX0XD55_9BACT|nr:glucosaminidase domain-containing protein [Neolewinella antarctica]NJC27234.1 LysM repeat protein [Neolewinella antarctica]
MPKFLCLFLALVCLGATDLSASSRVYSADQAAYVKRYNKIAMREMERSGVPASIKLAQGLLESDAGRSTLARTANNHFGIKCGRNWKGEEYYKKDDDYNSKGQLIKSCFRQYRNPEASFVAHSEFLRDPAKAFRYGFLFRLKPTDYKGWARGLRKSGYATNPRYPELLISLIDRYNLTQYDRPGAVDPVNVEGPVNEVVSGILRTNDVTYFISEAPVSVAEVAKQVDLSVERLLSYNENLNNNGQRINSGERVYLQKKRRAYRGREAYHTVESGETLFDVAQRYGLRLKILARRNRLKENADPSAGQRIKLRGSKVKEAPQLEGAARQPVLNQPNVPTTPSGQVEMDNSDGSNAGRPSPDAGQVVTPRTTRPSVPTTPETEPRFTNPPTTAPPTVVTPGNNPTYHNVRAKDTLYSISRQYGLTVTALQRLNGMSGTNISVGQQLRVK